MLIVGVAAAAPLAAAWLAPATQIIPAVVITTLASLAALGAIGAVAGGAPKLPATARVLFRGAAAMTITAGVGRVFGVSVWPWRHLVLFRSGSVVGAQAFRAAASPLLGMGLRLRFSSRLDRSSTYRGQFL